MASRVQIETFVYHPDNPETMFLYFQRDINNFLNDLADEGATVMSVHTFETQDLEKMPRYGLVPSDVCVVTYREKISKDNK